jgi:Sec-independent protein secretion pathway component TatC
MLTGLIGVDIGTELKTIAVVGVVVTGIILLAQKSYLKFTALEMATFAIAVALPIMASGLISQIALPAEWLSDTWNKIVIWGISCVSCVIMAFQD